MANEGVFAVHRGVFDHPMFAPEPFTEREAWLWMLSAAAWADKRVRVGKALVSLKRGQLAFATRFLADKWKWAHSKVVRFLNRLKTDTMIATLPTREATLITICNYDEYQFGRNATETQNETVNETPPERERNKEEETNNLKTDIDDGGKRAKLISDEAQATADAMATACGFPDPKACPLGWYGAAAWVQKCFNEGWPAELMIQATKETAARKRDGPIEYFKYLEKPLAKAIAEHSRPLPKVEFQEAETVVAYGRIQKTENLSAVARRLAATGVAFGERPATPSVCDLPRGSDVRLLPQGGGERSGDLRSGDGGSLERIPAGRD